MHDQEKKEKWKQYNTTFKGLINQFKIMAAAKMKQILLPTYIISAVVCLFRVNEIFEQKQNFSKLKKKG